jgi:hypothetical protein
MEPHAQGGEKLLRVYRLGEIVHSASLQAFFALALHRFCRQSDDGQLSALALFPDRLHRLIAIHLWHHNVHQNNCDLRIL